MEVTGKCVEGTDTFFVIHYDDTPDGIRKDITHTSVICKVRPQKKYPKRMKITISGNRICYLGDVVTPTASLELFKLLINSVLSRKGARFLCFDIKNFYLGTPLDRPKYARIHLKDIPQEFIAEYNLTNYARGSWVYFCICKGVYGLPQAGKLSNDLLQKRLSNKGYYEAATTPGLWFHKWRPVMLCLTVNDFGIKYVGGHHAKHLLTTLQEHYMVTTDWEGKKYTGIDIGWNYKYRT